MYYIFKISFEMLVKSSKVELSEVYTVQWRVSGQWDIIWLAIHEEWKQDYK